MPPDSGTPKRPAPSSPALRPPGLPIAHPDMRGKKKTCERASADVVGVAGHDTVVVVVGCCSNELFATILLYSARWVCCSFSRCGAGGGRCCGCCCRHRRRRCSRELIAKGLVALLLLWLSVFAHLDWPAATLAFRLCVVSTRICSSRQDIQVMAGGAAPWDCYRKGILP